MGGDDRCRARPGGAVRGGHGLPGALLHGDERARGHARDRAAHGSPGPPGVPPRGPGDASPDRRAGRSSRPRRRHAVRRPVGGRTGAMGRRARDRAARARRRAAAESPERIAAAVGADRGSRSRGGRRGGQRAGSKPDRAPRVECRRDRGYSGRAGAFRHLALEASSQPTIRQEDPRGPSQRQLQGESRGAGRHRGQGRPGRPRLQRGGQRPGSGPAERQPRQGDRPERGALAGDTRLRQGDAALQRGGRQARRRGRGAGRSAWICPSPRSAGAGRPASAR